MAGRRDRLIVVAALFCVAASCVYLAAGGDSSKPAAKDKDKKKSGTPAATPTPTAAQAPAAPPVSDPAAPVAIVGGHTFTLKDLALDYGMKMMGRVEFDQKRQALDDLINDQLLEKEAAAKGVPKEKLLETEVTSKVPDPAQADIDAWYEGNKARLGTQTKEQMAPQITAFLRAQKMGDSQRTYLASLHQKYGVKVLMEPPRFEVSLDDDASKGPAKAPVTIVEFSDYQCPFCSRAEGTVNEVLKKYGDKIHFVYRDFPLSMHQNAEVAAEASECAKDQGKFWQMHDAMFANQAKLSSQDLVETAAGLGLDKDKFKACIDSGAKKTEVQKDLQDAQTYGVSGTPTFFINGIKLVGARDVNSFSDIIDQELQRKN